MPTALVAQQPEPHARPLFARSPTESSLRPARLAKPKQKEHSAKLGFFGRPRNESDASSRKLLISAPTHFRHLSSGSRHAFPAMPLSMHPIIPVASRVPPTFEFPDTPRSPVPARRWESEFYRESLAPLEPLELSIFRTQNLLSPLLPQVEFPVKRPSPPPAYASEELKPDLTLRSQRSHPLPFRRDSPPQVSTKAEDDNSGSFSQTYVTTEQFSEGLEARTTADVEAIRARVDNAMLEVEQLQKKIDDVVERQSLYSPSRPSSAHSSRSLARNMHDLEPMPSIPAMPPSAPSFAERLHGDTEKPLPGSASSPSGGIRGKGWTKSPSIKKDDDGGSLSAMTPPLPLVLRPPLRKKKPFSGGLSTFIFPDPGRKRKGSLDSVTNKPRPIKNTEGFYQCVPVNDAHLSFGSLHSLSNSDDGDSSEARSVRSRNSPAMPREVPIERRGTFGRDVKEMHMSVGIAL